MKFKRVSLFRVGIQLLTSLLRHRGPEVQAAVMAQPTGVPHLVDIVHDRREVVRNEAVLMLCELSRSNSQVNSSCILSWTRCLFPFV